MRYRENCCNIMKVKYEESTTTKQSSRNPTQIDELRKNPN